ncbi:MAG TPA: hypothetical protein PLA50_10440 [Bacteroidia bacterium]|nr:hypothetical protein [Bacteroidia bacterium]
MHKPGETKKRLSRTKIWLLGLAGVVVLAGLVGKGLSSADATVPTGEDAAMRMDWNASQWLPQPEVSTQGGWEGVAVSLGTSFIVAMVVGSVLRTALRTGLLILFVGGVVVWFLDHRGYVDLWDEYYATARQGGDWISAQYAAVRAFLMEHLPSAGAALVGFGFGLKR